MKIIYDENGKSGKELNIQNLSEMTTFKNGNGIFAFNEILTEWNTNLSKLTDGSYMFYRSALESFNGDLSSLTNGSYMFSWTDFGSFNSDLSKLTNGSHMFAVCSALTSFNSDLSSLTNGDYMFNGCTSLASFDSDLSSLTDGRGMFSLCTALESFDRDLPSLTNGDDMFCNCTSLTSFNGDLSSLTSGDDMFKYCKLDTASVKNIASTINNLSDDGNTYWNRIYIGIGNSTPNSEEETAFNTMVSKGWMVYVNGSYWTSTASTNLTDGEEEQSTPIPYYAKPIQVTEDEAEYVDANNNYYNILGAQFIYGDDLSTYSQYTSFEHAESEIMTALNLTKIETK